ncbi:MAG TPA: hypothetical protein VG326_09520 [Tepidisphaeraceae bacterium]|nr:hypothetical protein [Tepidisphaeraceae bacterium]
MSVASCQWSVARNTKQIHVTAKSTFGQYSLSLPPLKTIDQQLPYKATSINHQLEQLSDCSRVSSFSGPACGAFFVTQGRFTNMRNAPATTNHSFF